MRLPQKKTIKKFVVSTVVASGLTFGVPAIVENVAAAEIQVEQLLHIGDRGEAVVTLQTKLAELNYYNYAIDGIYGPITASAVRQYQKDHGLLVDGIAGPVTLSSLFSGADVSRPSASVVDKLLRYGDRGEAVAHLQERLKGLGYYQGAIDGIYGPLTVQAVKEFQRRNGLVVDGIVGPMTRSALQNDPVAAGGNVVGTAESVIAVAKSLLGTPYKWGGTTPDGFDCSGFLNYVYEQVGYELPRTTNAIWIESGHVVSTPSPGDIVFFTNTYDTERKATHAGIYVGNGEFIHAGSDGVELASLTVSYWQDHFLL